MTERMKIVTIPAQPAREAKRPDDPVCDICGGVIDGSELDDWSDSSNATANLTEGTWYPEGGWGEEVKLHFHVACFKEKLIPWLQSVNPDFDAEAATREWGY